MKRPAIAPRLRHRVLIQRNEHTRDVDGSVIDLWTDYAANVPAEVMPMSGREFVAAQAVQAEVDTKITIREMNGVAPEMRVMHGSRIYNIKAVLPDPSFRRHLTLMAQTGVNEG